MMAAAAAAAAAAAVLVVSGAICSMTMRTNEIEILEETKTLYIW